MYALRSLLAGTVLVLSLPAWAQVFDGAKAVPFGKIARGDLNQQLQVQFPASMVKTDAFQVNCVPAIKGVSSWANNNTIWTYDIQESYPGLPGGAQCTITQTKNLTSEDGKTWKAGTINYKLEVEGPSVQYVSALGSVESEDGVIQIRESEPVVLIQFDGDINADSLFKGQGSYLNYTSGNAPAEKIPFVPLPDDKAASVRAYVIDQHLVSAKDSDWALATINTNLIQGAQIKLTVSGVTSKYTGQPSSDIFTQDLAVRSGFQAKVDCARPSENSPLCLPFTSITVQLSSKAKWNDIKQAYIEYVPSRAGVNAKRVRSFPEMQSSSEESLWNRSVNFLADYIPAVGRFSDSLVTEVSFKVNIEPQTSATVFIPEDLKDIDGRPLVNTNTKTQLMIGSPQEQIRLPQAVSFFERQVPNVSLPVGIVNLHQKLVITKSGADSKNWAPIRDPEVIVKTILAYSTRPTSRQTEVYETPLNALGVANNSQNAHLTGVINHTTYLQFPFGTMSGTKGGLYVMEISSPTLDAAGSVDEDGVKRYINPQYVLSQVTNLGIHIKRGTDQSVIWITQLDSGRSVANANIEIRNCHGEIVETLTSDQSGLAQFNNRSSWGKPCAESDQDHQYDTKNSFFVFAKSGDDFTFTHSSWYANNSYAMGAKGIEWYDSNIRQGEAFYHSVIGVNLVKPGQKIPVQIIGKMPMLTGFTAVPADKLPKMARITYSSDSDIYFDFPLKWNGGSANFTWEVPADSSVKLGQYEVNVIVDNYVQPIYNSSIEVAEFKVPLMTGILSVPAQPLVRPSSISANATVRYANGVGAKDLAVSYSYYFQNSPLTFDAFPEFKFGTGKLEKTDSMRESDTGLPSEDRPVLVEGLKTDSNGSVTLDVAAQSISEDTTIGVALAKVTRSQKMIVRARYLDQMGEYQTLSRSKEIYTADRFVGTNLVEGDRDQAFMQATVVGADGKPALSSNELSVSVYRINTKVIGEELYGGMIRNTYERETALANWKGQCKTAKNTLSCSVGTLKAGSYAFEAKIKNRPEMAANFLFKVDDQGRVYGNGSYYYFGDDETNREMPLVLNKEAYRVGEKAVASFSSPFKTCQALVTLERESVLKSYVVSDACQKGHVDLSVGGEMAPNMFVSVYAVTGRADQGRLELGDMDMGRPTYRLGFANLKIDAAAFKVGVSVNTDKAQYKPGETVQVQVQAAAELGALKNAKVTFVAIEEKILELKENKSYDVLQAFMQLRGHSVDTMTLLDRIETVTATNPDGELAAITDDRKGGEEGGDGDTSRGEMRRKLFDALVTFQSEIPVVNGVANASFKANDSLTKFKIFAIVTDENQKMGTSSATYLSTQDTQSTLNNPAIAYSGDQYPVRVAVQNNTGKTQTYKVEVTVVARDASGKIVSSDKLTRQSKIANASSVAVDVGDYQISDDASSIQYVVQIYDENGKLVDTLEPAAQKIYPSVPLAIHDSFVMQVEGSGFSRNFTKEEAAIVGKGDITTSVSSSLVDGVKAQILSKLANQGDDEINLENKLNAAVLSGSKEGAKALKTVLAMIVNNTDMNGFVRYYPQADRGNLWLTASILQTLASESWALEQVPDSLKQRFAKAVNSVLSGSVGSSYLGSKDASALFMAQIMYGTVADKFGGMPSNIQKVADAVNAIGETELKQWNGMALTQALWLLTETKGLAAAQSKVFKELTGGVRLRYTGNQVTLLGNPLYSLYGYEDETLNTAQLLMSLAKLQASVELTRPMVLGLVNASRAKWYVTRTMVWVSAGVKAFAKAYEADPVSGSTRVQLTSGQVDKAVNWSVEPTGATIVSPWTTSSETLNVTHQGQGKPWVSVNLRTAVPVKAPISQGMSIEKSIRNLTRAGSDTEAYQAGDIVEVSLTIRSSNTIYHVNLHDPIPAGSNIVGEAAGSFAYGEKSYSGYRFYFEGLSQGTYTIKYSYQLNNVGKFNMPPTRIEGIYMPSIFAEVPNAPIVIK